MPGKRCPRTHRRTPSPGRGSGAARTENCGTTSPGKRSPAIEERIPGQHEPRNPHPDELHDRHDPTGPPNQWCTPGFMRLAGIWANHLTSMSRTRMRLAAPYYNLYLVE